MNRAGFEAVYFARIDYQDSQRRRATKEYEMLWRPSPSLGLTGQVFAGAFPTGTYCPPTGFDWDKDSNDAPIQVYLSLSFLYFISLSLLSHVFLSLLFLEEIIMVK